MLRKIFDRRGDTLVEVAIAVGIFASVAVSVVAVVNISTSGAQTALENTLAREEIDSQAEALNFIHSAYINDSTYLDYDKDKDVMFKLYKAIWDKIKGYAEKNDNKERFDYSYKPATCGALYAMNGSTNYMTNNHAFIIDIKKLNDTRNINTDTDVNNFANEVVVSASGKFVPASTYPRLVYTRSNSSGDGQVESYKVDYNLLNRVEGLFIVGIVANDDTMIAVGSNVEKKAAYYDFYVRGCWYNEGADVPSTVSTVIRLRNPDLVTAR